MRTKTFFISVLFLLCAGTAFAQKFDEGDFSFSGKSDGTCTLSKYKGSGGVVEIPSAVTRTVKTVKAR